MQKVLFSSSSLPIHWPSFHLLGGEVAALALAAAAAAALLWFLTVSKLLAACVVSVAVSFSSAVAVALPPNALDTPMANCASSRAWTAAMSACSAFPRAVAVLQIQQIQAIINKENDDHYNLTHSVFYDQNSSEIVFLFCTLLFGSFSKCSIKLQSKKFITDKYETKSPEGNNDVNQRLDLIEGHSDARDELSGEKRAIIELS